MSQSKDQAESTTNDDRTAVFERLEEHYEGEELGRLFKAFRQSLEESEEANS